MKAKQSSPQFPIILRTKPKSNYNTRVFIDYPWDKLDPNTDQCFEASKTCPVNITPKNLKAELAKVRRACKLWLLKNKKTNWKFKISPVEYKPGLYQIIVWRIR